MILSVLIDGELRLYRETEGVVDEWGRLLISRPLTHETATRMVLDLAELAGVNGSGAGAIPSMTPAPLGLPPGVTMPKATRSGRQARILEELAQGPLTQTELRQATGWPTKVVSNALTQARAAGRVRLDARGRWELGPVQARPPKAQPRRRRAGRQAGVPTIVDQLRDTLIAGPPLTMAELADRTGLALDQVDRAIRYARDGGRATEADGRWSWVGKRPPRSPRSDVTAQDG